eukprot:6205437-Pleurochrysis_carterae.AAC.5
MNVRCRLFVLHKAAEVGAHKSGISPPIPLLRCLLPLTALRPAVQQGQRADARLDQAARQRTQRSTKVLASVDCQHLTSAETAHSDVDFPNLSMHEHESAQLNVYAFDSTRTLDKPLFGPSLHEEAWTRVLSQLGRKPTLVLGVFTLNPLNRSPERTGTYCLACVVLRESLRSSAFHMLHQGGALLAQVRVAFTLLSALISNI